MGLVDSNEYTVPETDIQTTTDANKSKLVSFAPCAGTNWLAYFDTAWYPQMNGNRAWVGCADDKWAQVAP